MNIRETGLDSMSPTSGGPDRNDPGDEGIDFATFEQWLKHTAERHGQKPDELLHQLVTAYPAVSDLTEIFDLPEWDEIRQEVERELNTVETTPEHDRVTVESAPEDPLDTVDFPSGRDLAACERAVVAAREYLREHGAASKRDIIENVMPAHPLGYEVPDLEPGESYRGAWWRRIVRPGLKALPEVEKPPPKAHKWRYIGPDGHGERDASG